jgi:hypothetical protein
MQLRKRRSERQIQLSMPGGHLDKGKAGRLYRFAVISIERFAEYYY